MKQHECCSLGHMWQGLVLWPFIRFLKTHMQLGQPLRLLSDWNKAH